VQPTAVIEWIVVKVIRLFSASFARYS